MIELTDTTNQSQILVSSDTKSFQRSDEGFSYGREGVGVEDNEIEGPVAPQNAPNIQFFEVFTLPRVFRTDPRGIRADLRGVRVESALKFLNLPAKICSPRGVCAEFW
jgi:hypothetical protein